MIGLSVSLHQGKKPDPSPQGGEGVVLELRFGSIILSVSLRLRSCKHCTQTTHLINTELNYSTSRNPFWNKTTCICVHNSCAVVATTTDQFSKRNCTPKLCNVNRLLEHSCWRSRQRIPTFPTKMQHVSCLSFRLPHSLFAIKPLVENWQKFWTFLSHFVTWRSEGFLRYQFTFHQIIQSAADVPAETLKPLSAPKARTPKCRKFEFQR